MKLLIRSLVLTVVFTAVAVGQEAGEPAGATPSEQAPALDLVVPHTAGAPAQDAADLPAPPPGIDPLYTQQATDPPGEVVEQMPDQQAADIAAAMTGDDTANGLAVTADDAGNNAALGNRAQNRLSDWRYYAQVVGALCFVLFLILVVGYLARRLGRRSPFLGGSDYGHVVGRLMLAPGASLHFVEAAGRILVVGVTKDRVALVAEYDAAEFHSAEEEEAPAHPMSRAAGAHANGGNFLAQLQQSSRAYDMPREDDEIASLRGDIQRLQAYLREESRESQG